MDTSAELRRKLIINSILIGAIIYFFKFTPFDAGLSSLMSACLFFLMNIYFNKKLKTASNGDTENLQLLISHNNLASQSWLLLSLIFTVINVFDIPALIKPYMNF